ncbi:hypothetical protein [Spirochaeta isovalerica]|uniref:Outer membrane protein beta-barrel domain-containing protein n=1 Tax=Spirochaeta isovalerica TaxID=150 RepID=A0A841R3Z0_9SPIO|nr:hypothetical protein [Spirochaeta isovalerica]MBB6478585.1 hypothetical protein [Spirochaeta isovalerica]
MKKLLIIFAYSLLLATPLALYSDDLEDFKNKVEQEEEKNNENSEDRDNSGNSKEKEHPFLRFLWDITFYLWFIHNDSVYYAPYPYELSSYREGTSFIAIDNGTEEEVKALNKTRKNYHFAIYGGGTFNEAFSTFGAMTRITGKFVNHMGPEIEYRFMADDSGYLHFLTTGINLAFFQTDYLAMDFYLEGAFFMGILQRTGISLGSAIYTYPVKPLSFEIRGGAVLFPSITFGELNIKAGLHMDRYEIFADFHTLQSQTSALYSFGFGVGVHF